MVVDRRHLGTNERRLSSLAGSFTEQRSCWTHKTGKDRTRLDWTKWVKHKVECL